MQLIQQAMQREEVPLDPNVPAVVSMHDEDPVLQHMNLILFDFKVCVQNNTVTDATIAALPRHFTTHTPNPYSHISTANAHLLRPHRLTAFTVTDADIDAWICLTVRALRAAVGSSSGSWQHRFVYSHMSMQVLEMLEQLK